MLRRIWAVVPPARVPEALEKALGVVVGVAYDEVDITAKGFFEEIENAVLRTVTGNGADGMAEVLDEGECHARLHLGFEEEDIF
jgi:hypothetical protein